MACPSLYSTIRLAHLVQHIRERLKSFIRKQDGPKGSTPYSHGRRKSVDAAKQAFFAMTPSQTLTDPCRRRHGSKSLPTSELGCADLLGDIDSRTPFGDLSLCKNAARDSWFLRHNFHQIANAKNLVPLRRVLDLTTALLGRMKCLRRTLSAEGHNDCGFCGLTFDDTISDKFYANLEHLLLSLQQTAVDAIVCLCLTMFVTDLFRWNHHQRDADEWFAEWPNAQHPLNTTWPWNVKTALLVLWGVCWMFYANGGAEAPFNGSQSGSYGQDFRTRQLGQLPPASSQPQAPAALTTPRAFPHFSYLHPIQGGTLPRRATEHNPAIAPQASQATYPTSASTFPYITPSPYVSSDLFPASTVAWPYASGSNSPSISVNTATATAWRPGSNLPIPFTETPQSVESFSPVDPYVNRRAPPQYQQQLQTPTPQSTGSNLSSLGFSLPLELQPDMQNYPSPQYSDVSGPTFTVHQKMMPGSNISPRIPVAASPSLAGSSESRQSSHRSLEPTRNVDGVLFCNHPVHGYNAPTFARKCEWSKHMDRHTRPYTCEEPGCENIRGFTYAGGLHRHQREVHRQHGGPKAKCMCPHQDCKRSTGLGFSRRENLLEHLRRVHRNVPSESRENQGEEQNSKAAESRKRRRQDDEGDDDPAAEGRESQSPRSLKQEVKKLRRELQESGERVRKLEQMVEQINKMQRKT